MPMQLRMLPKHNFSVLFAIVLSIAPLMVNGSCMNCETCIEPCECQGVELQLKEVAQHYSYAWVEARSAIEASVKVLSYSEKSSYSSAEVGYYVHAAAKSASYAAASAHELTAAIALSFGQVRCVWDHEVMAEALSVAYACGSSGSKAAAEAYSASEATAEAAAAAYACADAAAAAVAQAAACAQAASGAAANAYAEAFAHVRANCTHAFIEIEVNAKTIASAWAVARTCAIAAADRAVKTSVCTAAGAGLIVKAHAYADTAAGAAANVSTCAGVYTDILTKCDYDISDYYLDPSEYYYVQEIDGELDPIKNPFELGDNYTQIFLGSGALHGSCSDKEECECQGVELRKSAVASSYSQAWVKAFSAIDVAVKALVYSEAAAESAAAVAGYAHIAVQATTEASVHAQSYTEALTVAFGEIRCILSHEALAEAMSLSCACAEAGASAASYAFALSEATADASAEAYACADAAALAVADAKACAMAAAAAAAAAYASAEVTAFGNCTHAEIEVEAEAKTVASAWAAAKTCAEVVVLVATKAEACAATAAQVVLEAEVLAAASAEASANASTCVVSVSAAFVKCKSTPIEYLDQFGLYQMQPYMGPKIKGERFDKVKLDLPKIMGDMYAKNPVNTIGKYRGFIDGLAGSEVLIPLPVPTGPCAGKTGNKYKKCLKRLKKKALRKCIKKHCKYLENLALKLCKKELCSTHL